MILGIVLVALLAVVTVEVVGVPRVDAVTPRPGSWVRHASLHVVINVQGLNNLSHVSARLDDRAIVLNTTTGDRFAFFTGRLANGPHVISIAGDSSNPFRNKVRKTWRFTVDTTIPTLTLAHAQGAGTGGDLVANTAPARLSGTTEPGATVTATAGGAGGRAVADATGAFTVSMPLPDGPATVALKAADRAGNSVSRTVSVYVDSHPPILAVTRLPSTVRYTSPTIGVQSTDNMTTPEIKAQLDGAVVIVKGPSNRGVLKLTKLAEGVHTLLVTSRDRANVTVSRQSFLVDSTEKFGFATMMAGAQGHDVVQLQLALHREGLYSGPTTGVYDSATVQAVKAFERRSGQKVDGKVGTDVLAALSGRIVIVLGKLRLYLYRGETLVASYPVAAGQPAYPTPTGNYHVTVKIMNPTWYPPNSDWARNAKPIPPGVTNPLGTRWIGTSAPGVGIHGTPMDWSIGTYASHGCIRMHIPDVERLYPLVAVGMPVVIRW
jgi:lipoprotein-anchoring transpeptidase ErfK/SrfK